MAVCGKWKILTKRHLKSLDTPSVVSQLKDHALQYLSDLLLISGANADSTSIYDTISEKFSEKITDIVSSALSIQRATKEDIVSSEIRLTLPFLGAVFGFFLGDGVMPFSSADVSVILCICTFKSRETHHR